MSGHAPPAMNFAEAFMRNASGTIRNPDKPVKWNGGPSAFSRYLFPWVATCFSDIFYHTRSDEVFCTVRRSKTT